METDKKLTLIAFQIILLAISLPGCTTFMDFDDLKVKKQEVPFEIIIDGGITSEISTQIIKLSRPVQLGSTFEHKPVSDAEVTVSVNQKNWNFHENSNIPGYYESVFPFGGHPGDKFHLLVKVKDKIYEAHTFMAPVKPIDKENLPIWKGNAFEDPTLPGVMFSNHGFGFSKNNKWKLTILTQEIDQTFEISYPFYSHKGIDLSGALGSSTFDQEIPIDTLNDKIILTKYSLSPHYYKFLKALFRSTDWSGGIFDKVPANGISNISQGGYGYFFATQVDQDTISYQQIKSWSQMGKNPPRHPPKRETN